MIEEDATLIVDGVRIPGRIAKPAGVARATVLLLPGSLFSDADGDYPAWNVRPHVYRDLAHQLAALGIASMRQAKIGPALGAKSSTLPCHRRTSILRNALSSRAPPLRACARPHPMRRFSSLVIAKAQSLLRFSARGTTKASTA